MFTFRETSTKGEYLICPTNYETFPMNTKSGGSYGLAPARVLGVSPHEYFLYLMNKYPDDVEIRGKGRKYLTAYWKKGKGLTEFLRLLNHKAKEMEFK